MKSDQISPFSLGLPSISHPSTSRCLIYSKAGKPLNNDYSIVVPEDPGLSRHIPVTHFTE